MRSPVRRSASRVLAAVLGCVSLSGCGGGSTPTTPSPQYPAVAGNYSGAAKITLNKLGGSLDCPASTTVTQSGASVTLAPLTLTGACAGVGSVPLGRFALSTTGALALSQNNVPIADCNGAYNATADGGFSGSTLQFSLALTAVSGGCVSQPGNFSFSGTLTKQ